MGFWSRLQGLLDGAPQPGGVGLRLAPPKSWTSSSDLAPIVFGDIYGAANLPVTRWEAMRVPAIVAARWYITTVLPRFPLCLYSQEEVIRADRVKAAPTPADVQPAWLYRTDSNVPPQVRLLWTFDDMLFTGAALWQVTRDDAGAIMDAVRIPPERWDLEPDGDDMAILIDQEPVWDPTSVVYFTSPMDPLLDIAARTIRAAGGLEEAWSKRVKDPLPLVVISEEEDLELTKQEQLDRVQSYVTARQSPNGAVMYVPYGNKVAVFGEVEPQMYIEARNGAVLDVARFTGIPAALLSASAVNASLTYSTTISSRSELVDLGLAAWAMAIEARLSMDDVTPPGTCVRLDLGQMATTEPSNPPARD